jgi:CubicO group peptidase (beta-lactamase class C family)
MSMMSHQPPRIVGILLRAGARGLPFLLAVWCAPPLAAQDFEPVSRAIHKLVAEEQVPSIAVAVARDGRIIWEEGVGWADRERRVPTTPHTPYSLASISKPFTATAVMRLVEAGRLVLDRPANDYLDGAGITGARPDRATVRRVLSHTAGLPPYFRMRTGGGPPSFQDTIVTRAILRRPPGRRFVYSNLGYGILDHIIGRVSGLSYEEFMRREVFEPLQLESAFVAAAPPPDAAVRYEQHAALPFYDLDHRGASAVYASAHDLARFGMFHLSGGGRDDGPVLQRRSIRQMQRMHTRVSAGEGYGLGWRIDEDDLGLLQVGHTGGMPGVTTVLSLFPSERVVVVVLTNTRSEAVIPLARRLAGVAIPQYGWRLRQRTW